MANILGIDYYRVVSETGEGEWSQVFVKTAFGADELKLFGGVFGVIKLAGRGDLLAGGMGLINQIEKWIGEERHRGDVAGLLGLLKAWRATGAFVWVLVDGDGGRRVKIGALPGNGVALARNGNWIWLFENGDGRVMRGELEEGDRLFFGSKEAVSLIERDAGGLDDDLEAVTEKAATAMMSLAEGARAALILTVKPLPAEIENGQPEGEQSPKRTKTGGAPVQYRSEVNEQPGHRQTEKLASDRIVGAEGLAAKLAAARMSWQDLTLKWKQASRLPSGDQKEKKERWFLFLGGVFLVVLAISVGFGLVKASRERAEAVFKSVLEPLEKKRAEAEGLYEMNPVGARELIRSLREELAAKKGQFGQTKFEAKMADFERSVEASWVKISGEQRINLDLFFNLGLIRSGMKAERLAFDGKNLLLLDQTAGVVAKVSYPDKKQEVILGKGEKQNWLDVAGLGANGILLRRGGLTGVLSGRREELAFDAAVLDPVAVEVFGTAAYLLDRGASEIWRFSISGGVIGERRRWLLPGVEADLTAGADLAIDTDIWVGLSSGKILRFRRGQIERFSLSDLPEGFRIDRLAVSGDSGSLAVLDGARERIVLFNKGNGAYLKQILAPELMAATDLVWLNEKELMILSGDKIYQTTL